MTLYTAWFSQKHKLSNKMYKAYVEKGDVRDIYKYQYIESPISYVFRDINNKKIEATDYYPIKSTQKMEWSDIKYIGIIKAWIYNIYD